MENTWSCQYAFRYMMDYPMTREHVLFVTESLHDEHTKRWVERWRHNPVMLQVACNIANEIDEMLMGTIGN